MLRIDKAPNPIDTFVIQVSTPCVFIINRYDARQLNCISFDHCVLLLLAVRYSFDHASE